MARLHVDHMGRPVSCGLACRPEDRIHQFLTYGDPRPLPELPSRGWTTQHGQATLLAAEFAVEGPDSPNNVGAPPWLLTFLFDHDPVG